MPHAQAQVLFLVEQEKPAVEEPHPAHVPHIQEQRSADQPVGADIALRLDQLLRLLAEIERAEAFAEAAGREEHLRREDGGIGIALRGFEQPLQRPGLQHAVRIEQQRMGRRHPRQADVVGATEADVDLVADQLHLGQQAGNRVRGAVLAGVVHDHDVAQPAQRRQRIFQHMAAVVGHHDDGDRVGPVAHIRHNIRSASRSIPHPLANPLISVALCTYNGARFLREQLDSLLAQDYAPLEIVAVDDASSDDTVAILGEYARRDGRFRIHRNDANLGFRKNFEKVIGLCRGELIATCDQDDIWHPQKLSVLQKAIGSSALVYCDSEVVDESGAGLGVRASDLMNMYAGRDPNAFIFFNCVSGHAMLFNRRLVALATPFPALGYHDWWLAFVAASTDEVRYVDRCLVRFRRHRAAQSDMSKSKPIRVKKLLVDSRMDWLTTLRDYRDNPLLKRLCEEWERLPHRFVMPELFALLFWHRRSLFYIRKESALNTITRIFRFLWGLKAKALFNPAKYGATKQLDVSP